MGKKRKRNNKRVNPPEINKRILNSFLDMESDAGNMMELFGGFWPLIEKKRTGYIKHPRYNRSSTA